MRHSNPFMIREFIRLISEATSPAPPEPAEDDPELSPDVPPRDFIPGVTPPPRPAQRRIAPSRPKAEKAGGGAPGTEENLVDVLKQVGTKGVEALLASIAAKDMSVVSGDVEISQRAALERVTNSINRLSQFSGIELWTLPQEDPTVQEMIQKREELLKRIATSLPAAGMVSDAPTPSQVEGALISAGLFGRAVPVEVSAEVAANALAGIVYRQLTGTGGGKKGVALDKGAFEAMLKEIGAGLVENAGEPVFSAGRKTTSFSALNVDSKVKAGKGTAKLGIPYGIAAASLSEPSAISDYVGLVDIALGDTEKRIAEAGKEVEMPQEVPVTGPDPEALAAAEALRSESGGDDEEEAIKKYMKANPDSNATSEVKRQLGGWKAKAGPDGKTTFVNDFDRKLKPDAVKRVVDAFLSRVLEDEDLDPDDREVIEGMFEDFKSGTPAQQVDAIVKVLAVAGGDDAVLDYDQVSYSVIFAQGVETLIDNVVEDLIDTAEALKDDPVFDGMRETLERGLESMSRKTLVDAAMKALIESPQFQDKLERLDAGDLEDELGPLGVASARDAVEALKSGDKEVYKALQAAALAAGSPEASIVLDLKNAVSSGAKFAGFMRALNTLFQAGFSPAGIRQVFGLPSASSGRVKAGGAVDDETVRGGLAMKILGSIKPEDKAAKKALASFRAKLEDAYSASAGSSGL